MKQSVTEGKNLPFGVFCAVFLFEQALTFERGRAINFRFERQLSVKLQSHGDGAHEFQGIRGRDRDPFGNLVTFGLVTF